YSRCRRHTKFARDWSSDLCSSDLLAPFPFSITTSIYELQSPDPPTHRCPADSPRRRAEDGAAHGPADAGTRSQWWSAPGAGAQPRHGGGGVLPAVPDAERRGTVPAVRRSTP